MGDLGEALALIHGADEAVQTVRLTIRGGESVSRVWIEKPDRIRVEHEDSLEIQNGAAYWGYSREYGLHSSEDERMTVVSAPTLLLDPSPLLRLRLEALGRTTIAGRQALHLRTRPASEQTPSMALRMVFGHEVPALEVAVDLRRGILLRYASFADGQPRGCSEVVEVSFDECFAPGTFVWTPSPDRLLPEPSRAVEEHVGPHEVSLEEAARLASFPVFALNLPDQWRCSASSKPERPWKHKRPKPPYYAKAFAETVHLNYHLAGGSHQLYVAESAAEGSGDLADQQGVWTPHEYEGHTTWVWTATEASPGARRPPSIRLKREGTILTISSITLEVEQLLQLAGRLRRVF